MLERGEGGTIVAVWVVPGAVRTRISGPHGEALKVHVAAPAEGGRANKAMLRLLSDRTGARCALQGGAKSRLKAVLVQGREPSEVAAALGIEWNAARGRR